MNQSRLFVDKLTNSYPTLHKITPLTFARQYDVDDVTKSINLTVECTRLQAA